MRKDLEAAWNAAKANKKADIYNRFPKPDDIEPRLSVDEKVLMLLKGTIQPARIDRMKDLTMNGGVGTLVLTDKRVHYFGRGVVKSLQNSHETVEFSKINGVELRKNLTFGQMIYITRPANTDTWMYLNTDEAEAFVSKLQEFVAAADTGSKVLVSTHDPLDQIKKLKDLLDAGVITQEEFESKKSDLMGRI